jgi:hypothetical protein
MTQIPLDESGTVDLAQPPVPALVGYYDTLLAGDSDSLQRLLTGEPHINTPLHGEIKGPAALSQFVPEQQAWLKQREAHSELINAIVSDQRIVIELVLYMKQQARVIDLPVALAADRDGERLSEIHVYHSTWPLSGDHIVRAPIVRPAAEKLEEPAVVKAYMAAIQKPDRELVLSLFVKDCYVRKPSGSRYKHARAEGLRNFYGAALNAGGVVLHHCTAAFDGHAFAVEYICDEWANVELPPHAGLAVYELAGPDKLQAARIYNDVLPPFE